VKNILRTQTSLITKKKNRLKKTATPKKFKEDSSDEEFHVQTPTKVYSAERTLNLCTPSKSKSLFLPSPIISPGMYLLYYIYMYVYTFY